MNIGIDKTYVTNAIEQLMSILGISEEMPVSRIMTPTNPAETKLLIESIARYLRLPVRIHVINVPDDYRPPDTSSFGGNAFHSSDMVITDSYGKATASIVAQVQIPSYLPMFGSPKMEGFPINVMVSVDAVSNSYAFVSIMAHELTHIVLYSIQHTEKNNEVYTDLAAMLLGFSTIMKHARSNKRIGYLNDDLFWCAYSRISELLGERTQAKCDLLSIAHNSEIMLLQFEKLFIRFTRLMQYVDNSRLSKKFKHADRIVEFHQTDYTKKYSTQIQKTKQELLQIRKYCTELLHYTPTAYDGIHKLSQQAITVQSNLKANLSLLQDDTKILTTYVGRFRLWLNKL